MKLYLYILAICFFLSSCTSLQDKTVDSKSPLYKYKADIAITINDQTTDGMAVTNLVPNQIIKIVSKAKLDLLIISSCQRFETYEKVDKNWFGGVGKEFKYTYTPTETELNDKCPLYFQAFDKSGLTAWGYVAFKTDDKLKAKVECNGKTIQSVGFTLCQSKNGFEQSIMFDTPIKYFRESACNLEKISDYKFKIVPGVGFCNATFDDGTNTHQITFLGFEEAMVRGE